MRFEPFVVCPLLAKHAVQAMLHAHKPPCEHCNIPQACCFVDDGLFSVVVTKDAVLIFGER